MRKISQGGMLSRNEDVDDANDILNTDDNIDDQVEHFMENNEFHFD